MPTYRHLIDFEDRASANVARCALDRISDTVSTTYPEQYHFAGEVQTECSIEVVTYWTESALDNWLWRVKAGAGYTGVVCLEDIPADDELGLSGLPCQ